MSKQLTVGQIFASDMRKNLGIGTRTRRFNAKKFGGHDMHRTILEAIANATFESGYYGEPREAIFRTAFAAYSSYEKHIHNYRASAEVVSHINALSPWQFCNLIAEMIDAGISNVGDGERFFIRMRDELRDKTSHQSGLACVDALCETGGTPQDTTPGDTVKHFNTVASITGAKSHYRNPRTDLTFCGREISNGSTDDNMCKLCVKAVEKMADYADRISYDARVSETQDDVMNEAAPVEPAADRKVSRKYKLTARMVEMLRAATVKDVSDDRIGTVVALIRRGLLTTATSKTDHRNQLTDKGRAVVAELNGAPAPQTADEAADDVIRRHKLSDTMIETLTYRYSTLTEAVNAEMWCDAKTEQALVKRGLMHPTESYRTELGHAVARTILAVITRPAPQIPGQLDMLNEIGDAVESAVEYDDCSTPAGDDVPQQAPAAAAEPFWQRLGGHQLSYRMLDALGSLLTGQHDGTPTAGTWQSLVDLGLVVPRADGQDAGHEITASGRATYASIMDLPVAVPDEQLKPVSDARAIGRDRYAKTVAESLGRSNAVFERFHADGSVPDPDRFIREIRIVMAEIVMRNNETGFMDTYRLTQRIVECAWLLAYVMELGDVDADGWQDRRRGPVEGWADLQTYDLDPDSAEGLPAWADHGGEDALCGAVIRSMLRDEPAEHCGNGVTREAYYAAGEVVMCEEHQAAYDRAGDEPW